MRFLQWEVGIIALNERQVQEINDTLKEHIQNLSEELAFPTPPIVNTFRIDFESVASPVFTSESKMAGSARIRADYFDECLFDIMREKARNNVKLALIVPHDRFVEKDTDVGSHGSEIYEYITNGAPYLIQQDYAVICYGSEGLESRVDLFDATHMHCSDKDTCRGCKEKHAHTCYWRLLSFVFGNSHKVKEKLPIR
jgi:hypothetical protein